MTGAERLAELERQHGGPVETSATARLCRRQARCLAKDLGVEPPEWCRTRENSRRQTLEALEARFKKALTERRRSDIRCCARALAKRRGVDVPAWAAVKSKRGASPDHIRPIFGSGPLPAPRPTRASIAIPRVPEALVAWRRARVGAVVRVGQGGVELFDFVGPPLRFASLAEAVAAVTA